METTNAADADAVGAKAATGRGAPLLDARFLVAVVALIVNDQILKALYGNWVTGKLSDVAGLVVLPVVVGVVLHAVGFRRHIATACSAVGLWFAAMKLSPVVAGRTELMFEFITRRPSTIVVDPTDLLGLLGLVVAANVMANPRPLFTRRQVGYLSLAVAAFACTATSGPEYYETDLGVDPETGEVVQADNNPWIDDEDEPFTNSGFEPDAESSLVDRDGEASQASGGVKPPRVDVEDDTVVGLGEYATHACLSEVDGSDCFRIVDGRIERRSPGEEWQLEWAAFDNALVQNHVHGGWGPAIKANDIVVAPDGTVHVGFNDEMGPIVRSVDGRWSPGFHLFRPLGWLALAYVGFVATALAAATPMRKSAGFTFVAATGAAVALMISWTGSYLGLELLLAVGLVAIAVAISLFATIVSVKRKARMDRRRLAVAAAGMGLGLVVGLVWKLVVSAPQDLYVFALLVAFAGVVVMLFIPHRPPPAPIAANAISVPSTDAM